MSTFHSSGHFHHKTIRTTAMQRVRCAHCRSRFEREDAFWTNNLQRICSAECFEAWRKAKNAKKRGARAKAPKTPIALRYQVKERDQMCCRWCGAPSTECHHIIYRSQGGPDHEGNLISLCQEHHMLVHSSKPTYQPLLLGYIWLLYADGIQMTIPQVAAFLERLGERMAN